jgi:hypothetical protein
MTKDVPGCIASRTTDVAEAALQRRSIVPRHAPLDEAHLEAAVAAQFHAVAMKSPRTMCPHMACLRTTFIAPAYHSECAELQVGRFRAGSAIDRQVMQTDLRVMQ